eukprot:2754719-Pleurochrysis_carterae.AAC.1
MRSGEGGGVRSARWRPSARRRPRWKPRPSRARRRGRGPQQRQIQTGKRRASACPASSGIARAESAADGGSSRECWGKRW